MSAEKTMKATDVLSYAENYKQTYLERYKDMRLSDLPEALGIPCDKLTLPAIHAIPSALETNMVASLLEEEEFSDVKIAGVFSGIDHAGTPTDAFVLSMGRYSVSENISDEDDEMFAGEYLCYCIFVTDDSAFAGIDFLNLEDIEPSIFDGLPASSIKELLPLPGGKR